MVGISLDASGNQPEHLADLLRQARRVALLTGAGMSTESGVPDFRSANGIYSTVTSAGIFDIGSFRRDPGAFFRFARTFLGDMRRAHPNAGHRVIAALEDHGWAVDVVTQNIDALHQQAGSTAVYPVHGTLETCSCTHCGEPCLLDAVWPRVAAGAIPRHDCGGILKPDIVFFGEELPQATVRRAIRAMEMADLVLILGTSLTVHPAAGLPGLRRAGASLAIVNRTPTDLDPAAEVVIRSDIGPTLAAVAAALGLAWHSPRD